MTMGRTYGLAGAFGGAQPGNTSVRSPRGCIGTPCMRPCGVYDAGAMRPSWCESVATQARGPGTLQSSRSLWPKPRSQTPDVFVLGKSELVVGSGEFFRLQSRRIGDEEYGVALGQLINKFIAWNPRILLHFPQ